MRLLRRALLLLGLLGLLAMHGLAPTGGTDVLAAGPHQHPAVLLDLTGPALDLTGPAPWDPAVTDGGRKGHARPDDAMPGEAMPAPAGVAPAGVAWSGAPSPDHGGHGSHLDGLCLAVLAGGVAFVLALAVLGRQCFGASAAAALRRLGHARAAVWVARPPDLARLCVLRI